jgi:hypothetical protein
MKDDRGSPGENLEVALEWLKQYKRARLRLSRLFETGRVGRSLGRCSEKRSSEKNVSMHVRPAKERRCGWSRLQPRSLSQYTHDR